MSSANLKTVLREVLTRIPSPIHMCPAMYPLAALVSSLGRITDLESYCVVIGLQCYTLCPTAPFAGPRLASYEQQGPISPIQIHQAGMHT